MNRAQRVANYGIVFMCPACDQHHAVRTEGVPRWDWNGSLELPTISPSIRCRTLFPDRVHVCHSFVKDGKIEYCSDCTHALAGQTVDLPGIER